MTRIRASHFGTAIVLFGILAGCSAALEGEEEYSPETLAQDTAKLATCAWGAGEWVRTGDVNLDGLLDILSPNGNSIERYQAIGTSGTRFVYTNISSMGGWGDSPYAFSGDFTGDGRADIVSFFGGLAFTKTATSSSFSSRISTVTDAWGTAGYTFSGNFNADSRMDIASASGSNVYMKLATGSATGNSFSGQTWPVSNSWGPAALTFAADFTGDGLTDIATAKPLATMVLLKSTGNGFTITSSNLTSLWSPNGSEFVGDFNGDGRKDIAALWDGRAQMRFGTNTGFTFATWNLSGLLGSKGFTWVGDFDGNGIDDIASASGSNVYMKLSTGSSFVSQTWTVPGTWGQAAYTKSGLFTNRTSSSGRRLPSIVTANGCTLVHYVSTGSGFETITS